MKPWVHLDQSPVPGTDGVMDLWRWGKEYVIRVDGRELMSTRVHGSEDALADLACDRLKSFEEARILVGGLGMGFTAMAALKRVGAEGKVVVAELLPAVARWNRTICGEAAGHPLADPRASVFQGDVAEMIRRPPEPWDAILLDVDNGPEGLTRASNGWLYSASGLDSAFAALRPSGVLGVWSAHPDAAFTRRFERAGFEVEPIEVRAGGKKGGHRHMVWIGVRKAEAPSWSKVKGV